MGSVPNLAVWIVSVYNDGKGDVTQREGNIGRLDSGKQVGGRAREVGFGTSAKVQKCKSARRIHISGERRVAAFFSISTAWEG